MRQRIGPRPLPIHWLVILIHIDGAHHLQGIDGFLGTRASFMLDVVFLAMFAVVPVLAYSVWLVKVRKDYQLHKRIQLALGAVLLVTVTAFEVDVRVNGWKHRAESSPYFGSTGSPGLVYPVLYVHLCFAVSTTLLWALVIVRAWRNFPSPPVPSQHSDWHRRWAKVAAWDMLATSLTGWTFYWLAFVA